MNGIFDAHKGVYRVNNEDGTFDTYTPEQYRELVAKENEVEIEDVVIVDEAILEENPILAENGVKVGDLGVATNDAPADVVVDEAADVPAGDLSNTVIITDEPNQEK